ncbi:MAG: transporter [Hyphomicrobiales bacterium]|nr:transporter [Hyphomicrobiales bacterium]
MVWLKTPAFAAFLCAYVLSQFYRAFLAVVAGDLTRDLKLGAAELGDLSAIWFVTFAFAQFPVGMALDRFGPRRTVSGLFLVAVAGAAWFATARGFGDAAAAMALIGIGCSPILMGSMYYFGRTAPPERFAMLVSLILGVGSLGNLLSAAPLAWAVTVIGWRSSIALIAAATAISAIAVYLVIRDPERVVVLDKSGDGLISGLVAIFSLRPILLMAPLVLVSYASVVSLRSLWIAPFFGDVHGYDVAQRGNAAFVMAVAMTLGALAFGPLERRLGGPKNTVLLGTVLAIAALAFLAAMGATSPALALVVYAVFGFTAMTYVIMMAHARMFYPAHLLGRGVTALNFLFIGGAGLMQWVSGRLVEGATTAGWTPAATYATLHGTLAAIVAAATLIYLLTPARPRPT